MKDNNVISLKKLEGNFRDHLTKILRQRCVLILREALRREINTMVEYFKYPNNEGRHKIMRSRYLPVQRYRLVPIA